MTLQKLEVPIIKDSKYQTVMIINICRAMFISIKL